jgi:TPR repeat protein
MRRAAEQGLAEAQVALGDAYHLGRGVSRSDEAAREWYQRAANQHSKIATARLAQLQQ